MEKVSKIFVHECSLNKVDPVIVGVSGGADSICLLEMFTRDGFRPVVAHFNHGIRSEAEDEAEFVKTISESKGLCLVKATRSVPEHAESNSLSLEESARLLRYQFLFEQAEMLNAQAVAVAHNADDQVETILMHLLRGTGMKGLIGMSFRTLPNPWSDAIPLVRPLLTIWRKEIEIYCRENHLETVFDRTNLDPKYLRNQIRHELIPIMDDIVPGFKQRLGRTADILRADQKVLVDLTNQVWESLILERGKGFISVQLKLFQKQPLGIQRRLIMRAAQEVVQDLTDIDYDFVDRVISYGTNPRIGREVDAGSGLKVLVEEDKLHLGSWDATLVTNQWPQLPEEMTLPIPGEIQLGSNWRLRVEKCRDVPKARNSAYENENPNIAWIDPGEDSSHLQVRSKRPGDRFQPLGMAGCSMKVSDYLINQKIPRRAREHWPLLCVKDRIAWIVGYHLAHPFRLREETREVLKCSLKTD